MVLNGEEGDDEMGELGEAVVDAEVEVLETVSTGTERQSDAEQVEDDVKGTSGASKEEVMS